MENVGSLLDRPRIATPEDASESGNRSATSHRALCVARQPIVRADFTLEAYELLYRPGAETDELPQGHTATTQVLVDTFAEIGLDRIVGSHQAFVNLTREFYVGDVSLPSRPDRLVLEILEDESIDQELLAGVRRLQSAGFQIALDDVVFNRRLTPLLELADYVKLELPAIPTRELPRHVDSFRAWPVQLLAEKVETEEQFEQCRSLGFDLYQGFFHARPEVLQGTSHRINKAIVVQLLTLICQPSTSFEEMEAVIQQDPELCFKFLKYVNSSVFGLREITSLRHGLVLLGRNGVATMASLLKIAGMGDVPSHVITRAMVRGQMCSTLGSRMGGAPVSDFCTIGVLSMLEPLTNQGLDDLVAELRLSDQLAGALLSYEGTLGEVLRSVIAYEHASWDDARLPGLSQQAILDAYLTAVSRADEIAEALRTSPA